MRDWISMAGRVVLPALFVVLSGGSAAAQPPSKHTEILPSKKDVTRLQALTPAGVAAGATIKDDDLETVVEISTAPAFRSNGGFTDPVRSDNFVRALIDKRSGKTVFQVYQEITYTTPYRNFTSATYATPAGPIQVPLLELAHEVVNCAYGTCTSKDIVCFEVDEATLRATATPYTPGQSPYWRFRFQSRAGIEWNDRMMPAEVGGLLAAVETYRRSHPTLVR